MGKRQPQQPSPNHDHNARPIRDHSVLSSSFPDNPLPSIAITVVDCYLGHHCPPSFTSTTAVGVVVVIMSTIAIAVIVHRRYLRSKHHRCCLAGVVVVVRERGPLPPGNSSPPPPWIANAADAEDALNATAVTVDCHEVHSAAKRGRLLPIAPCHPSRMPALSSLS